MTSSKILRRAATMIDNVAHDLTLREKVSRRLLAHAADIRDLAVAMEQNDPDLDEA